MKLGAFLCSFSTSHHTSVPIAQCFTANTPVTFTLMRLWVKQQLQVHHMAPRLRSSAREVKHAAVLETGLPVNTRGLPAFPVELLLEILSYTSEAAAPIPNKIAKPLSPKYLERTTTLRTLSQLCRSLRTVLLPALWERIEAWATTAEYAPDSLDKTTAWHKGIATDLIAQLETVTIRAPSLASYVRIVNVLITPHSADTVLVELARCMALMQNLHTVQISSYHSFVRLPRRGNPITISELYKDAFAEYCFPSVRRIAFNSPWETALLRCFPEARRVYMRLLRRAYAWDGSQKDRVLTLAKKLASRCPKVQVFEWDPESDRPWDIAKEIHDMLPNLRQVRVFTKHDTVESIQTLAELKDLDTIVLTVSSGDEKKIEQMVLGARAVLTASPSSKPKTLIVKRSGVTDMTIF